MRRTACMPSRKLNVNLGYPGYFYENARNNNNRLFDSVQCQKSISLNADEISEGAIMP